MAGVMGRPSVAIERPDVPPTASSEEALGFLGIVLGPEGCGMAANVSAAMTSCGEMVFFPLAVALSCEL